MNAVPTADQRVDRLASRQHGVISRSQALACGLTHRQVDLRLASRRWLAVGRGIFRVAGAPSTWRSNAMAAVLTGPAHTVASHLTAAAAHGLTTAPLLPHVTVPRPASGRQRLAVVHHGTVERIHWATVDAIPVTAPARTLIDCAVLLGFDGLAALVDPACSRGLVTPEAVVAAIDATGRAPGRRGTALLRAVLTVWSSGVAPGSPAEARLLRRLRAWGYDPPVRQFRVHAADGRLLAIFDLAWPASRVAHEYDGVEHHGPRTWAREEARDARLEALGWWVGRVGRRDLLPDATRLRDDLERQFRLRRAA